MPLGLPDFWQGRRLPETTLSPYQWFLLGVAGGTLKAKTWGRLVVGTPEQGYAWIIYRVKVCTETNSLISVGIARAGTVYQRETGYGIVEINIPKGFDFRAGEYMEIHVYNYADFDINVLINFSGLVVKL